MADDTGTPRTSDESSKRPVGLVITVLTAAVIAIFILSNTQDAEVNFLWLDTSLQLWLVIIASVALGVFIGRSFSAWQRHRRRKQIS